MPDYFTDFTGTRHTPAGNNPRIISLVPSLTELLFELDLADQVVGRTNFCVHPAEQVKHIQAIGGTKKINTGKVKSLTPTHAVVNIDETPKELAEELTALGLDVIVTHPGCPDDNPALFRLFGGIFNRPERAKELCIRYDEAIRELQKNTFPPRKVLYLIWQDPWMTVSSDTYISKALGLVGWQTVSHDSEIRYPAVELTANLLRTVDIVLFSSEPFPFQQKHITEFHRAFPEFDGKSVIIDAEMVSWYGSRAIPGLSYLTDFAKNLTS